MGLYLITETGNRFILVVANLITRWVEAFSMRRATSVHIAEKLEKKGILCYPRTLISDNGTQFANNRWTRFCHQVHVLHWTTVVYYSRANP